MTQSVVEMACGREEKLDGVLTWDHHMLCVCIYIAWEYWRRLLRPGLRRRGLLLHAGKKNNDKAEDLVRNTLSYHQPSYLSLISTPSCPPPAHSSYSYSQPLQAWAPRRP